MTPHEAAARGTGKMAGGPRGPRAAIHPCPEKRLRHPDDLCPSRRSLLRGLAGAVLLPGVLAACTSGETAAAAPKVSGSVPASEVPVGAARVVKVGGTSLVLAQPVEGEFVAFGSACTHQGTRVRAEDGLTVSCPNHGSRFSAADGSVERGPAKLALPAVPVRLEGSDLLIG